MVGLGSNLGDRASTLERARSEIARIAYVRATSRIWATKPVGGPPQPDYLNAAIAIDWPLEPRALLQELQRIEHALGRVRTVVNGPRTIDLDILWMDGVVVADPDLVIPHPRLAERAFAVVPLLEVLPEAPYQVPTADDLIVVGEFGSAK